MHFNLFQLFPTLIINIAALSSGMSLGYSAIALPQLKPYMDHHEGEEGIVTQDRPPWEHRPFTVDEEQGSWIGKRSTVQNAPL